MKETKAMSKKKVEKLIEMFRTNPDEAILHFVKYLEQRLYAYGEQTIVVNSRKKVLTRILVTKAKKKDECLRAYTAFSIEFGEIGEGDTLDKAIMDLKRTIYKKIDILRKNRKMHYLFADKFAYLEPLYNKFVEVIK
jgi:hypothetical protein